MLSAHMAFIRWYVVLYFYRGIYYTALNSLRFSVVLRVVIMYYYFGDDIMKGYEKFLISIFYKVEVHIFKFMCIQQEISVRADGFHSSYVVLYFYHEINSSALHSMWFSMALDIVIMYYSGEDIMKIYEKFYFSNKYIL